MKRKIVLHSQQLDCVVQELMKSYRCELPPSDADLIDVRIGEAEAHIRVRIEFRQRDKEKVLDRVRIYIDGEEVEATNIEEITSTVKETLEYINNQLISNEKEQ